jgi:F-type H+-transporting ATPase subunit gamma
MEALEQTRQRLATLQELQSIVASMKALAASSIHQYQRAVHALASYHRSIELGLHVVLRDASPRASPAARSRRPAAVVFGSDYGLCGRFNEDIVEYAHGQMTAIAAGNDWRVLVLGARAAALLGQHRRLEPAPQLPASAPAITGTVRRILQQVQAWRSHAEVTEVHVFYQRSLSSTRYRPVGLRMLPVPVERFRELEEAPWPSRSLPTYTLPAERLLTALLQQYFFVVLFRACAESLASEHGSRLAAMQVAEKNLDERRGDVLAQYRRRRQDAITAELLDLVAGFQTLEPGP